MHNCVFMLDYKLQNKSCILIYNFTAIHFYQQVQTLRHLMQVQKTKVEVIRHSAIRCKDANKQDWKIGMPY